MIWTLIQFWLHLLAGCGMFEDWSGVCNGYYTVGVPW